MLSHLLFKVKCSLFKKLSISFKAFCINLQNLYITKFLPFVNGMIMGNSKARVSPWPNNASHVRTGSQSTRTPVHQYYWECYLCLIYYITYAFDNYTLRERSSGGYIEIALSVRLSVSPSVRLSVRPSVRPSVCLSVRLCRFVSGP